jgi:hypothetical protein
MLIQHYVANVVIGPTTLRNQPSDKVAEKARDFLTTRIDLNELKNKQITDYRNWLDKKTKELMNWFPDGAKDDWGAARKAINLFMIGAYFNRILFEKYKLDRFKNVLETPLDGRAAKRLREYGKKKGVAWMCKLCSEDARKSCKKQRLRCGDSAFPGIVNLKEYQSRGYQEVATEFAREVGLPLAEIDIVLWGATDNNWENILQNIVSV